MNFMFKVDEKKQFLEKIHKILLKDSILNEEMKNFQSFKQHLIYSKKFSYVSN